MLQNNVLPCSGHHSQHDQPHTPEHNGMAERVNRTLFEWARCMMQQAKRGHEVWAIAVQAAAYLYNRTKTVRRMDGPADSAAVSGATGGAAAAAAAGAPASPPTYHLVTPEEAWSNRKPSVKHVRTLFSDCFVPVPDVNRPKMEAKAPRAIFVGYPESQPGWRVLNLETGKLWGVSYHVGSEMAASPFAVSRSRARACGGCSLAGDDGSQDGCTPPQLHVVAGVAARWTQGDRIEVGAGAQTASRWLSAALTARLTAKGCAQRAGVDYAETFAPPLDRTRLSVCCCSTRLRP